QAGLGIESGKNITPQWTQDSRALQVIADRDGTPNLYRVAIDSGELRQVTRVATGLSGITASSPALSVASKSGVAAFSVYEGGKYDIYLTEVPGPGRTGEAGEAGALTGSSTLSETV